MDRAPETFIASEARVAYFSQDLDTLDPEKTVLENVAEDAAYPQHICRAVLVNLYMTKDDMFKPVSVLSGGEKVKTALAKVLVSGCSFMILDEPTNIWMCIPWRVWNICWKATTERCWPSATTVPS